MNQLRPLKKPKEPSKACLPLSRPFSEGRGCLAEIPPAACCLPSCNIESPCGTNPAPLLGCFGWFSGHDQNFAFVPLIVWFSARGKTHRKINNYYYIDSDMNRCCYLFISCVSRFCTFNLLLYEKVVKRFFWRRRSWFRNLIWPPPLSLSSGA